MRMAGAIGIRARKLAMFEELDYHLTEQTQENKFSGVVLAARDGEPIFHQAYGLASKRFGVPNRLDTRFNLASLNKIFTIVATLQLVEKGLLDLDDPLGKYRPDFPPEVGNRVIIRHLLTQRSGWGDYWGNEAYLANWAALRKVEDYMAFIKDIPLEFEPGQGQQHCNTGFEVLGAVIETVTGQSYYDYVRAHIFEPAGMADTDSYERDLPVGNLATGYTNFSPPGVKHGQGHQRENTFMLPVRGTPAGGGYSTAVDLLKFGWAFRRCELLSPRYTAMIFNQFNDVETLPSEVVTGFTFAGAAAGVNTFYGARSADDAIVLSNYDPPAAMEIGARIMERLETDVTG